MINIFFVVLSIVITIVATLVAVMAFVEWRNLSKLKKELEKNIQQYRDEINSSFNATHKVLASYQVEDIKRRIELLKQATAIQPSVYNGYNTLGYAYITDKNYAQAIEAFTKAIFYNPNDPAGYCDLAYAYLLLENKNACKQNLEKAISLDNKQKTMLLQDTRFQGIFE